jgi:hypothetical protein
MVVRDPIKIFAQMYVLRTLNTSGFVLTSENNVTNYENNRLKTFSLHCFLYPDNFFLYLVKVLPTYILTEMKKVNFSTLFINEAHTFAHKSF